MRAHQKAVLAALRAAAGSMPVHEAGDVPDAPVTPYLVLSTDSGTPGNYRVAATTDTLRYRVAVQFFGKTFNEAAIAAERADAALRDKTVPVPGRITTPCRREIATNITRDPDGGSLLGGLHTYLLTSNPTE